MTPTRARCWWLALLGLVLASAPVRADADQDAAIDRLEQVTTLFGYLRFYHPSDQAAAAAWDAAYVDAVSMALGARDTEPFEDALRAQVQQLAPTADIGRWTASEREAFNEPLTAPEDATHHRVWVHNGVGLPGFSGGGGVYSSVRARIPLDDEMDPVPGDRVLKGLGHGLWLALPLSVFDDGRVTLPYVPPEASRDEWRDPDRLDVRVAAVAQTWAVFQHFYPYFDTVGVDWEAERRAALAEALTTQDRWDGADALERLVARTQDGHGRVIVDRKPGALRLPIAWEWVKDADDWVLCVMPTVAPGQVPAGSVIEAINDKPVTELCDLRSRQIASATPGWTRHRLLDELRWTESDQVVVRARLPDGERRDIAIQPLPPGHPDAEPVRPQGRFSGQMVTPDVMYFQLAGATSGQLRTELRRMAKVDGVVFDLRGYPDSAGQRLLQHLAIDNVHSAWWRIPQTSRPNREDVVWNESRWDLRPRRPGVRGRVVFITDGSAISYAESVMGVVEHHRLGEIVGTPTAGTNGNVNVFTTAGGYQIAFTGMRVEKHDRTPHHGVGVAPTVLAEPTLAGARAGRDELLDIAIRLASGELDGPVLDGVAGPLRWEATLDTLSLDAER